MKFLVLKKTRNNLLLKSDENKPVREKTSLYYRGREAGFVFETIASVRSPFYLAKGSEELVGKTLESKRRRFN